MSDFTIHNDFNELEFLFDSESTDVLGDITKNRFKDNLLFAIIETVTISTVKGVGTTQYLSYKKVDFIKKTIHKDYLQIIDEIKGTAFGSPAQYYDWYKRDKFYYAVGENKNAKPTIGTILNGAIIKPEEKPESKEYIIEYDRVLSDKEIRQFFTDYTNCLLAKDWFKELPHYFILVKPISIKDKETNLYIPLGNLYLKIGTKQKVELTTYKKYVNHLKSVWFNKFGDKILKEYSDKKTSDEYKPKIKNSKPLLNKFTKELFSIGGRSITLNDFFYYGFDLDGFSNLKHDHLFYSSHPLIKKIILAYNDKEKISEIIKGTYSSKEDPLNILNKTISGLKNIDEASVKYFFLLLSKRRLALALLLVFGFKLEEARNALTFGARSTKTNSTIKDHTDFFLNNLFITQSNPPKSIIPLLADREVLFLKNVVEEIKKKNPAFTCLIVN